MSTRSATLSLIMLFGLFSAGCGGARSAQMIASFPQSTPIAVYPQRVTIVYEAYIELIVTDVDRAAEQAAQKAYDYGGYLASSNSWYVDSRKNTSLVLAVPTHNYERLRRALLGLGDLISEQVSGELVAPPYREPQFSHITLNLRPGRISGIILPPVSPSGWDPGRTFQLAFSVFLSIFGFIADILIWVVVVVGPFVLVGWLLWLIFRRVHRVDPGTNTTGAEDGDLSA